MLILLIFFSTLYPINYHHARLFCAQNVNDVATMNTVAQSVIIILKRL